MLEFNSSITSRTFKPLDRVTLVSDGTGCISVRDGDFREYLKLPAAPELTFTVGGALGKQTATLYSDSGEVKKTLKFNVDCETSIEEDEYYKKLLNMLYFTMIGRWGLNYGRYNDKMYAFFVCWVRDHTHVLKGMKYFEDNLKSALELYRDSQREDGMIFDNFYPREKDLSFFEQKFREGDFCRPTADRHYEFRRIPVEADVEYLYIEGIYNTWRATGDDDWMAGMLDSAVKAVEYDLSSPYRWSKKYNLVKRGFTIDTWDFQSWMDTQKVGFIMLVDLDKTEFGVMHGDNTGLSQSCRYLAKMLERAGRKEEADKCRKVADDLKRRLDELSWNGSFYTHHVPENPDVDRSALGVDLDKQLSLSNAYALNRGLTHEQCKSIIKEYLKIKENLPAGSAGEWYTIYPPFENFNGDHSRKWEYMNAGVISIVAGELARGAFENGFEDYGIDILDRIYKLADKHDGYLHCTYKGAIEPRPETNYRKLDLSTFANGDFYSELNVQDDPNMLREEYDLDRRPVGEFAFRDVPFRVTEAEKNSGKGTVILSQRPDALKSTTIPVNGKAKSLYIMHTMSGAGLCGQITIEYADGTKSDKYVTEGREIGRWYQPERKKFYGEARAANMELVWHGKNKDCDRVGVSAYCYNNPNPDKEIKNITLTRTENGSAWYVFAITLSDQDAFFKSTDISFGIPDNWGAAAVMYSLIEGLAGVVDNSAAFEDVTVSPRWSYAGTDKITFTVKYPASSGYVSYKYRNEKLDRKLVMEITGSGADMKLHCLIPRGAEKAEWVKVDGSSVAYDISKVEGSSYADFKVPASKPCTVEIGY